MSAVTAPVRHPRWSGPGQSTAGREAMPGRRTRSGRSSPTARPQLRVVSRPSRRVRTQHRHVAAWVAVMAVVFCGAVFGVVALNAMAAAEAVEARQIEASLTAGERRLSNLVAEVAALEEPARIRSLAEEAGMVSASTVRFLPVERPLLADHGFDSVFAQRTSVTSSSEVGTRESPSAVAAAE